MLKPRLVSLNQIYLSRFGTGALGTYLGYGAIESDVRVTNEDLAFDINVVPKVGI